MSSRVSSLQIPDYVHPYNCFALLHYLLYLFTLGFSRFLSSWHPYSKIFFFNGRVVSALWRKKKTCLNKQSNFSTHTTETTVIHLLGFWGCMINNCFMSLCAHHQSLIFKTFLKKVMSLAHDLKVSENIALCCAFCVSRLKGLQPQKPHGQLKRKPFCGFPLHLLIPVDASCLLCSMKDEMTADHRVRVPLPRGRQQLESSGQRGITVVCKQRQRWPLTLWPFSISVNGCPISHITGLSGLQCLAEHAMLRYQWHHGSLALI